MNDLNRINVKIFTPSPPGTALEPFLGLLAKWKDQEEHWLDIADYLHMVDGPGVVLYGTKYFISLDNTGGLTGILYGNRSPLEGDLNQRFETVLKRSIETAKAILKDELCPKEISSKINTLEMTINDRKKVPQNENLIKTAIHNALSKSLGEQEPQLSKINDPHQLFGYTAHLQKPVDLRN